MKRFYYFLPAVLLVMAMIMGACDTAEPAPTPEPTPTTGVISGRLTLPAGASGSIENTRVAIYADYNDWATDRVLKSASASSNGSYVFNNLTPNTYYLDAWKDNNNDRVWNGGDFVGVYGSGVYPNYQLSPLGVQAGQNTSCNVELIIVP
jgi:hypothetical protein